MRLRLSASSSMSKTVGMGPSAKFCQATSLKPRVFGAWLKKAGTERPRLPALPAQLRIEIDLIGPHFESDRPEQIRNALAAFHGFFQAAREEFDVFLVRFEREFSFRKVLGQ